MLDCVSALRCQHFFPDGDLVNEVAPWFIFFVDNSRDQAGLVLARLIVSAFAVPYLVQSSFH